MPIPIIFIITFLFPHLLEKGKFGDCDPTYINMVKLQQEISDYMKEKSSRDASIQASFLTKVSLSQPSAGYISKDDAFHNFVWDGSHKYLLSVNNEFQSLAEQNPHEILKQIQIGEAKVNIYKSVK